MYKIDVYVFNNLINEILGKKYSNFRLYGKEVTIDSSHYSTLFSYTINLNILIIQSGDLKATLLWNPILNKYDNSKLLSLVFNQILEEDDYMIWLCRQQLLSLSTK